MYFFALLVLTSAGYGHTSVTQVAKYLTKTECEQYSNLLKKEYKAIYDKELRTICLESQ